MSLMEKAYISFGISTLIAQIGYFIWVWRQSHILGEIAPPSWTVFGAYLGIAIGLGLLSTIVVSVLEVLRTEDKEDLYALDAFDERDELVERNSLSTAHYVTGTCVYLALAGYLLHQNTNLLFHSVLGAIMLGELSVFTLFVINYRRTS